MGFGVQNNDEEPYHGVLHVGVDSRLLRVDTDLDRIVDAPAKSVVPSAALESTLCMYRIAPLDWHKNVQPSRHRRPHRSLCVSFFRINVPLQVKEGIVPRLSAKISKI
jgi:hypothetical protein